MDENTLRQKARAAIVAGKLPHRRPDRTWGGKGGGIACSVCGEAVAPQDLEYELEYASGSGSSPGLGSYHLHVRCFAAWDAERIKTVTHERNATHGCES